MTKRITLIYFFLLSTVVFSQVTYTWNGSVSTNWGTATNWTPNGVPGTSPSDIVMVNGLASGVYPTLDANRTIQSLNINTLSGFYPSLNFGGMILNVTATSNLNYSNISNGTLRSAQLGNCLFNTFTGFTVQKTGIFNSDWGGNTFLSNCSIISAANGSVWAFSSLGFPDKFLNDITVSVTGTTGNSNYAINLSNSSTTTYTGNIFLYQSSTSGSNAISFGSNGGGSRLVSGKAIYAMFSNGGNLSINNFTSVGTNSHTISIVQGSLFINSVDFNAPFFATAAGINLSTVNGIRNLFRDDVSLIQNGDFGYYVFFTNTNKSFYGFINTTSGGTDFAYNLFNVNSGTTSLIKDGRSAYGFSGGNTFTGIANITLAGMASMSLDNTVPSLYLNNVYFTNNSIRGDGDMWITQSASSPTRFLGDIYVAKSAGTNARALGIGCGNAIALQASGKSIYTNGTFSSGSLQLWNYTQTGVVSNNLVLSNASLLISRGAYLGKTFVTSTGVSLTSVVGVAGRSARFYDDADIFVNATTSGCNFAANGMIFEANAKIVTGNLCYDNCQFNTVNSTTGTTYIQHYGNWAWSTTNSNNSYFGVTTITSKALTSASSQPAPFWLGEGGGWPNYPPHGENYFNKVYFISDNGGQLQVSRRGNNYFRNDVFLAILTNSGNNIGELKIGDYGDASSGYTTISGGKLWNADKILGNLTIHRLTKTANVKDSLFLHGEPNNSRTLIISSSFFDNDLGLGSALHPQASCCDRQNALTFENSTVAGNFIYVSPVFGYWFSGYKGLRNSVFNTLPNKTSLIVKQSGQNGPGPDQCAGGNTFKGNTTLWNQSSNRGIQYSTSSGDIYEKDLTIIQTGSGQSTDLSYSGNNIFNGNVYVNNTGSGVYFGRNGGLSTILGGKLIAVGTYCGFTAGTLEFNYFTQLGTTAQVISVSGDNTNLRILNNCNFKSSNLKIFVPFTSGWPYTPLTLSNSIFASNSTDTVNITANKLTINNCSFMGNTGIYKTFDETDNNGGNTFFSRASFFYNYNGGNSWRLGSGNPDFYVGDVFFVSTIGGRIRACFTGVSTFSGNFFSYLSNNGSTSNIIGDNGGTALFKSSSNQAIYNRTNVALQFTNLSVDKSSNTLSLMNNVSVVSALTLANGLVDLNGYSLTMVSNTPGNLSRTNGYVLSETSNWASKFTWRIGSGTGTFVYPFGSTNGNYIPLSLVINGGTPGDVWASTYRPSDMTNLTPFPSPATHLNRYGTSNVANVAKRFWHISATGTSFSAGAAFNIDVANELATSAPASYRAQRWGTAWGVPDWETAPGGQSYSAGTVTLVSVPGFSSWAIAGSITPLPLDIVRFNVINKNGDAHLSWKNDLEKGVAKFEVEKSKDAKNFSKIATVLYDSDNVYFSIDKNLETGKTYYRIRKVMTSGENNYSEVKYVSQNELNREAELIIYPNPIKSGKEFFVKLNNLNNENVTLNIYDIIGNKVFSKVIEASGTLEVEIDTFINPGLYIVKAVYNDTSLIKKLIIE